MITLKIKVKREDRTYTEKVYVLEDFSICKNNPQLLEMINDVIIRSQLEKPDEVTLSTKFEI